MILLPLLLLVAQGPIAGMVVGPESSIVCPAGAVAIVAPQSIPDAVDKAPAGTTFCVKASTHWPTRPTYLKAGDKLIGEFGAVINCTDEAGAATRAEVLAAARAMGRRSPTYAPLGSWWLMACQGWVPDRVPLEQPTAPDAPPLLVVGTRHDPATPYPGAVSLAEMLGSGHLLTWEGYGHTAYLRESPCVDEIVDAYLLELTVPEDGALCLA